VNSTIADLMRHNLRDVFNQPDPEPRSAAIAQTYAHDVVWWPSIRLLPPAAGPLTALVPL
jgi:hypothetical protein